MTEKKNRLRSRFDNSIRKELDCYECHFTTQIRVTPLVTILTNFESDDKVAAVPFAFVLPEIPIQKVAAAWHAFDFGRSNATRRRGDKRLRKWGKTGKLYMPENAIFCRSQLITPVRYILMGSRKGLEFRIVSLNYR